MHDFSNETSSLRGDFMTRELEPGPDSPATSAFVQSWLPRLLAEQRLPPVDELSVASVMGVWRRQLRVRLAQKGVRAAKVIAESCQAPSENELRALVDRQAEFAWERLSQMLAGRARIQLCMLGVSDLEDAPEDLSQTALARARERHEQFRGATDAEYRGWIKMILDHLLIDRCRARRPLRQRPGGIRAVDEQCEQSSMGSSLWMADPRQITSSEMARRKESVDLLYLALERLPDDERRIVTAKLAERTFEEIAVECGLPKSTVVRRYHAALAWLRHELERLT